jgi:ABC-type bacteriocin/lantibiotic exporter with double-glycine peptidase domain
MNLQRRISGVLLLLPLLACGCYRPAFDTELYAGSERLPEDASFEAQRTVNDCAIAAAATLLRLQGHSVSYAELARGVELERFGLSLADLRSLLRRRGVRTEGIRLSPADFAEISPPLIAWLSAGHYVVLTASQNGQVIVSDPARGRWRVPEERLWEIWDGTALIAESEAIEFMGPTPMLRSTHLNHTGS